MTQGYLMLAQNSIDDYVKQACLCAMSLHATNKSPKISLVTNDPVPNEYLEYFDQIIEIPWGDAAAESSWKIENRWKLYHVSPYDETVVIDTDMLVLQDLSSWWTFLSNYDIYFTSNVYTYRGQLVTDTFYRRGFIANDLPSLYTGFHYFKKSDRALEFYTWMELITNNWELFYGNFHKKHYPKHPSMDRTAAITAKILDCENEITNSTVRYPTFTHMKPRCQGWKTSFERWQDAVAVYFSPTKLMIGNYQQTGIFHYTENDFITDDMLTQYKDYLK